VGEIARYNQAVVAYEGFAGCADALLAVGCERDVGCTGMAPVKGPFCFAMADDEDARVGHDYGVFGWGMEVAALCTVYCERCLPIECTRTRPIDPHVAMTSRRAELPLHQEPRLQSNASFWLTLPDQLHSSYRHERVNMATSEISVRAYINLLFHSCLKN
jgi:hypothetical protein